MSRKLALVQWSKTLAVLLIIAGLQILLLDVALFIAYVLNSKDAKQQEYLVHMLEEMSFGLDRLL